MKIYKVGGAVRDKYLSISSKDTDWVVVGATVDELLSQGYTSVGRDFPVFLHPNTHEEYALARTERKIGKGYTGFSVYAAPDVSLEDDLCRRDLTINAMAEDSEGKLTDPFNGLADLRAGILRHVSAAFVEDPVRILRVARFAARFNFRVADETLALMQQMVQNSEVDSLVPERVWQEMVRALAEPQLQLFFDVLQSCGALARIFPEIDYSSLHLQKYNDIQITFAVLCKAVTSIEQLCKRYKVPSQYRDLAILVARHDCTKLFTATSIVETLQKLDAFRRSQRFEQFLIATETDACETLRNAFKIVKNIEVAAVLVDGFQGAAISKELQRRRIQALS